MLLQEYPEKTESVIELLSEQENQDLKQKKKKRETKQASLLYKDAYFFGLKMDKKKKNEKTSSLVSVSSPTPSYFSEDSTL